MLSKNFSRKFVSVMVASATVLALMATPAFAAANTEVSITGGDLTGGVITYVPFGTVALDGTAKTLTAVWKISDVVDARGTGAGWDLKLTLTPLKEYVDTAYKTDGRTFASSSIKVTAVPDVSMVDASSSDSADIVVIPINTAFDTVTGASLLTAAKDTGMGSYAVSDFSVELSIPASAYVATYKTDATVTIVVAP